MLVNGKEMLKKARDNNEVIYHFNINNLEWSKIILETCQKLNQQVILGVSEGAIRYMGGYNVVSNLVKNLINDLNITIDVCLHLDHGSNYESCKNAIDAGFTSVMIDASKLELDENIKVTKEIVDYAHPKGVTVEAEVGHIGGTEDNITSDIFYATLEECKKIYDETGIDSLAPALGSVHGFYKGEPNLNFERMDLINKELPIPLVLHGGSGIPDDKIKKAISCGISKINVNTELQVSWSKAVREFLNNDEKAYDPRKVIGSGEKAMKDTIEAKVKLFGTRI